MKKHNLFFIVGLFTACLLLGGCSLKTLDEKAASVTGTEKEAVEYLYEDSLNGREGFFCIKSCEDLTLKQALETYRQKDSIEKLIHSLKNEIEIKPVRVWSENSVYGALLIGFLAQLVISLLRYVHVELKHTCTKFIKKSLVNLTLTVEKTKNKVTRLLYSNFDPINTVIIGQNTTVT